MLGTFCYNPQAVFPIYFVMKLSKAPKEKGYWKKQREMKGVEAQWDVHSGKYKLYTKYNREMSGDDIGVWFKYDTEENEQISVKVGVSFVSIENARENMEHEISGFPFDEIQKAARDSWNNDLSRIQVEGGTKDEKTIFYTGLYHLLIHPNILQDVNGEYPKMESLEVGKTDRNRYTVFSLWDTYRNVTTLMTLLYPDRQLDIINTMIDMYKMKMIPNKKLRSYMTNYLAIMMTVSSILLIRSKKEENLQKKKELWEYLKKSEYKTYWKIRYGILGQTMNLPGKSGRKISVLGYKVARRLFGFN